LLTIFNLLLDTSRGGKPTRTGGDALKGPTLESENAISIPNYLRDRLCDAKRCKLTQFRFDEITFDDTNLRDIMIQTGAIPFALAYQGGRDE